VIPADVELEDLDPAGWAWLNELVLRARRHRRWVYVLHSGGRVVTVHPDDAGVIGGEPVEDPVALAGRLLRPDVQRVVVIDRDLLPALARDAAELVVPGGALTVYREGVDDLYWSRVATAPGRPANPWRRLRLAAESLGEGAVVLAVTTPGFIATVGLTIHNGTVVRICSGSTDSSDVVLGIESEDFVCCLQSTDLFSSLLAASAAHPLTRGSEFLGAVRPLPTVERSSS
jgi:hypothetical protein